MNSENNRPFFPALSRRSFVKASALTTGAFFINTKFSLKMLEEEPASPFTVPWLQPLRFPNYAIPLPDWLRRCIEHVPPGRGDSCPTDTEALLASAFHFAYQLHANQVRASGEPYIVHPVAVADLLRDIGDRKSTRLNSSHRT